MPFEAASGAATHAWRVFRFIHFGLPAVNLHSKFTAIFTRSLKIPDYSFFLFGPRGTGKRTWLRHACPDAYWKNLLLDEDYLPLLGDPSSIRLQVEAQPNGTWIVIDEVQRIPRLLNEVHDLISRYGESYRLALSGSSARKLRGLDVNLLAGRAIERRMFPLTSCELGTEFDLEEALRIGTLPPVMQRKEYAIDILSAYVSTYLQQEIQQQALVEDVGAFHRFLKVVDIVNGEIVNISGIARDVGVAPTTAERYFDILVDTLIAVRLPAWQPRLKVRERRAPKYYVFDPGVVWALNGRIRDSLTDLERGKLLETYVLHELRSTMAYRNCGGELSYWQSSGGAEIDFVWTRGDQAIAIEVKNSKTWRKNDGRVLKDVLDTRHVTQAFGVYHGHERLRDGGVVVLPCHEFLEKLHAGEIIG